MDENNDNNSDNSKNKEVGVEIEIGTQNLKQEKQANDDQNDEKHQHEPQNTNKSEVFGLAMASEQAMDKMEETIEENIKNVKSHPFMLAHFICCVLIWVAAINSILIIFWLQALAKIPAAMDVTLTSEYIFNDTITRTVKQVILCQPYLHIYCFFSFQIYVCDFQKLRPICFLGIEKKKKNRILLWGDWENELLINAVLCLKMMTGYGQTQVSYFVVWHCLVCWSSVFFFFLSCV